MQSREVRQKWVEQGYVLPKQSRQALNTDRLDPREKQKGLHTEIRIVDPAIIPVDGGHLLVHRFRIPGRNEPVLDPVAIHAGIPDSDRWHAKTPHHDLTNAGHDFFRHRLLELGHVVRGPGFLMVPEKPAASLLARLLKRIFGR